MESFVFSIIKFDGKISSQLWHLVENATLELRRSFARSLENEKQINNKGKLWQK